jgi:hypothetical protein
MRAFAAMLLALCAACASAQVTVSSFTPLSDVSAGGATITVEGTGFVAPFMVQIGGVICPGTSQISRGTQVTGLMVPPGSGSGLPIVIYSGTHPALTLPQTFSYTGGGFSDLEYDELRVGGVLIPGGQALVTAVVHNRGSDPGSYTDVPPLVFYFEQNGVDVTSLFVGPGAPSPALPLTINAGQTRNITWAFSIDSSIELGDAGASLTGGGPQNPQFGIAGFFTIREKNIQSGSSSGGCTSTSLSGGTVMLLALLLALGVCGWSFGDGADSAVHSNQTGASCFARF